MGASQELEAKLAADLEAKRKAIDEAEAAVEQLQERIRVESVDAGELEPQVPTRVGCGRALRLHDLGHPRTPPRRRDACGASWSLPRVG